VQGNGNLAKLALGVPGHQQDVIAFTQNGNTSAYFCGPYARLPRSARR
jgi:hypothetical protein